MIITWLLAALRFLGKLIIPPPAVETQRKIDPNAVCPCCGHTEGTIKSVFMGGKPQVQHRCKICDAKFYEDTVVADPRLIDASLPPTKE